MNRDLSLQTDQIKSLVNLNLSSKADLRDVDNLQHAVLSKADISKVQELVSTLRTEIVTQLAQIKKDFTTKSKKKEDESKKKAQETQIETEKMIEEIKSNKDKIQKLAVQFDKELADRDKQSNSMRNILL